MVENAKRGNVLKKVLKIFGWFVFSIVLLFIAVALLIQLPAVQNRLIQKAVAYLEKKIGTDVSLARIRISFPKTIVLEGLFFEDQENDTLLYAGEFAVNTDLWALSRREIQLKEVRLENCKAYISRPENDSAYNFSYILKAFAGDSTATPDTLEQKGWTFSVGEIDLRKVRAKYSDGLTGNFADLALGKLEVSISKFDLEEMKILVDNIVLTDTRADVRQTKQPEVTEEVAEEKQPFTYDIGVAKIKLENVHAGFIQEAIGASMRIDVGSSELVTDRIDLKQNRIDLEQFSLRNSFASYQKLHPKATAEATRDPEPVREKIAEESAPWIVTLTSLDLQNNSLQYYDFTKPVTRGLDVDHLWISNFNVDAKDIKLNGAAVACRLNNVSFREKSGFAVNRFATSIDVRNNGVNIRDLVAVTPHSAIRLEAGASFPSLADLADHYADATFRLGLGSSSIGVRDILYFNPSLPDSLPFKLPAGSNVSVQGSLHGSVSNIRVGELALRVLAGTYLKANGTIRGLPETSALNLALEVQELRTTREDLAAILPDTLLPQAAVLPEWVALEAKYDGSLLKSSFNAEVESSLGEVIVLGSMDLDSASATRGFSGEISLESLDAGAILGQPDTIGTVSLDAVASVRGLSRDEMTGTFNAVIKEFTYLKYPYRDLKVEGEINSGVYGVIASLKDKNLGFLLDANLDFSDETPRYDITFDLQNANFKALGISERPLRARGTFETDISTGDFRRLNGTVGLRKVAIFNGETLYAVDSLLFASIDQEGRSELKIDSDIMSGYFEGSFNVFSIADVLRQYFSTYYAVHDTTLSKPVEHQYFDFDLKLKKTELLTGILVPELESFVPGEIRGTFDSRKKQLDMKIDIKEILYSNIGIKSLLISTNSDSAKLAYDILADEITMDSVKVDGLEFGGTVANDTILANLIILDSLDKQKYLLGTRFRSLDQEYELSLLPGRVMLNYVDWDVNPSNYLRFGGSRLYAKDIELSNMRERIIVDSKDEDPSTLLIAFREFNLEYLVSMINREKAASGLLHGDIYLVPDTSNMTFTADIGVSDLNISGIPWGDLNLVVNHESANRYDVTIGLLSDANDLRVNGYYLAGENPRIDLTAVINAFDLATVEPLTMGQLSDLQGGLSGRLRLTGTTQSPNIRGAFNFNDISFFSNYLKSAFSITDETIAFDDEGILFNDFDLLDNKANRATLDGRIATTDYSNFRLRLDLETQDFRLLNTTEKDNELFYGRVDLDATVKIRGTFSEPAVTMQIAPGPESRLTYVVPQAEASVMEQEGIVRFVDKTFENDPFMKTIDPADTVKSQFTGLDLTARIELTDQETFTVIIDPTTGDQLTVRGNTTLTLNMDPTGDLHLTGRYEITEGSYNLSFYKFIKRQFLIEQGSTMIWEGDPLNAVMDITAIYEVETAPIDLLSAQLEQSEMNRYKQRLPFQVFLNVKGELLKPEISFRLDMPEDERDYAEGNVYARLMDINTREADLNKQVFALLLLKRFISDNPFENQGASGLEGTARTSVSKLLTEQLNRLSQNVRGVELSFDLKSYEDYSSGQAEGQTELQLGLSKNLFNDRLVVKVAGNVGIEGESADQEVTDYIGDLALEYKLTEDGRFRITGFRNSNYDMIDGELTETGTGLIYVKDYNLISELFRENERQKVKRKK